MQARAETVSAAEESVAVEAACAPVQVRSRFVPAVVLRIAGPADETLVRAVDRLLQQAPHFFVNAPIVLDLERAGSLRGKSEFQRLVHRLQSRRLQVIGVQNATQEQRVDAAGAGLLHLPKGGEKPIDVTQRDSGRQAAPEAAQEASAPSPASGGVMITEPVRSGQVIFADRGDLTVLAPVSSGAELVAAGSIHVYGRLSGRALAGVNGDERARIFCQSLEADLIAIAGLYRASDDLDPALRGKRVQAYLENDSLKIDPLR